jgi:GTP-binding protein Era
VDGDTGARGLMRSGIVAIAGRPNVGKSTLVNAVVGVKVAIVSDKPQTTRRAIRGVANGPDWQLVLTDLPGVQRPKDELTQRMQNRVERELEDADAALLVLNAIQGVGPGDRFLATLLAGSPVPVVIAVNKVDRAPEARVMETLAAAAALGVGEEIFPISARSGRGMRPLVDDLVTRLADGPALYPLDDASDQPVAVLLAELIREQVLRRTRQEIPHAVEVEIEEANLEADPGWIRAYAWVETESQKGILIGAGGRMIRAIGTAARKEIELHLGRHVHLDLSVRVRRSWRGDERLLDRLGID